MQSETAFFIFDPQQPYCLGPIADVECVIGSEPFDARKIIRMLHRWLATSRDNQNVIDRLGPRHLARSLRLSESCKMMMSLKSFERVWCYEDSIGLNDMRVLVVEDDAKISSFIVKGLKQSGYVAHAIGHGTDALRLLRTEPFDLLIVDLMLPGMDGLTLIEWMRREKINSPVLILSAKRTVDDRVRGLQVGGDDYLTKPFAFSELLARVQALIRRATGASETTKLSAGNLEMNLITREVTRAGVKIDLAPREFSLLEYLLRNAGRVVSKAMIMEHVWDYNFDPMTNVVEARMCKLREKIDSDSEVKLIQTIRGFGYVIRESP